MSETFVTLFDTAIGRCGLAWGADGIVAVSFPEPDDAKTLAHMRRRAPEAQEPKEIPAPVADAIAGIRALASGLPADFGATELDMGGIGDFERQVYALSRRIAPGETRTYGELARELGDIALSRRVGQALGRNPFPIIVPCHRIVGAGGVMTGFSAPGGTKTKRNLLKIEGALGPDLFDLIEG
jgi:methylated-DNA-[protein]-cysteine S-methyltransferase